MSYNITPILSTGPLNSNVGFNNSWVTIDNDFSRPLFAQLTYATNLNELITYIDDVESLIIVSNTLLDTLTSNIQYVLNSIDAYTSYFLSLTADANNIKLNSDELVLLSYNITSILVDKQDQLISLGNSLTSIQVDKQDQLISLGNSLTSGNIKTPGFNIPPHDEIDITYSGSTNNIEKVLYINNSTTVLSLSFTYIPNPPIIDNAILKNIKKL